MQVWPGEPYPLGAVWNGFGVNFAIFSEHATRVELCLFDAPSAEVESHRIDIRERTNFVWHTYLPDIRPGQLYGYRVHGPYEPERGHRFNPAKLLLDPYARAIGGDVRLTDAIFGYDRGSDRADLSRDDRDSAADLPKCVVIDPAFSWLEDRPPRTPWSRTVIYETHVKGMTQLHPGVPPEIRGTYLGLACEPVIEHLRKLGVTAVELMPVHHHVDEPRLVRRGLTNYWGYNTIGFFAPDSRFASGSPGEQVFEFKMMVKALHAAGIEVILDVVYNHTGEGDELGPTILFRGIDNRSYYHLDSSDPRRYVDFTGTGNTLNMLNARAMQLMMDSLRYWVEEMHVDGLRFDLAPALARGVFDGGRHAWFFDIIQQDPILSRVKLIAEPWDVGPGGYQVGSFPNGWAEWNDRYRDTIRRYWRGDAAQLADVGFRLSGSSDLYGRQGRSPYASINFVTGHDGFTLHDLVSYDHKHNEANLEENRDGTDANWSRNWGVEGPTKEAKIRRRRLGMKKNFLATLALSQGVPMLSHGDEIGRTQNGNNNAYCQDDETTWIDWDLSDEDRELLAFTRRVFAIRQANPVLRRRTFLRGHPTDGEEVKDVTWYRPDGREMTGADWHDPENRVIGMLLHGDGTDEVDRRGRRIRGDTLLLLFNASERSRRFALPVLDESGGWRELLNTHGNPGGESELDAVHLSAWSLLLLRHGAERTVAGNGGNGP